MSCKRSDNSHDNVVMTTKIPELFCTLPQTIFLGRACFKEFGSRCAKESNEIRKTRGSKTKRISVLLFETITAILILKTMNIILKKIRTSILMEIETSFRDGVFRTRHYPTLSRSLFSQPRILRQTRFI